MTTAAQSRTDSATTGGARSLRVAFYGAGAMAIEIADGLRKRGHTLVAALDLRRPAPPLGDVFVDDVAALADARPEVVVHCTPRDGDLRGELLSLIDAGCDVVSISGVANLQAVDPAVAAELDEAARSRGVRVLGTGVNPGFVLDLVPIFFIGGCVEVSSVQARRTVDLGVYGESVLAMYGMSLTPDAWDAQVAAGRITLHREIVQSVHLIAAALGVELQSVTEDKTPVVADGRVVGFRHTCRGTPGIELEMLGLLELDRAADTTVTIKGDPDLCIVMGGGITDRPERVVAARVINALPWLIDAPPGLHTPAELPVALPVPFAAFPA